MTTKTKRQVYQYRLETTGGSSQRYGNCEACGKHCAEVYHQVEERVLPLGGYTQLDCTNYFGHEECLKEMRR